MLIKNSFSICWCLIKLQNVIINQIHFNTFGEELISGCTFLFRGKKAYHWRLTLYKWQGTHIFDSKLPKTWLWLDGLLKNKKKYLVNFTLPHNVTHSLKLMSFVSGWSNIHYNNLMWLNEIQAESNSRQRWPAVSHIFEGALIASQGPLLSQLGS